MSMPIILILFYAALYDIKHCKLPNKISFIILCLGVIQAFIGILDSESGAFHNVFNLVAGFTISLFISFSLYRLGLFGAGDAKLLASLGAIFGPIDIVILISISISFSGLLTLFRLSCHGELYPMLTRWYQSARVGYYLKPENNTIASSAVPMGGSILLATVFCEFYIF